MHKLWQEFLHNWMNDEYDRTMYGLGLGRRGWGLCINAPSDVTVQYISKILQGHSVAKIFDRLCFYLLAEFLEFSA